MKPQMDASPDPKFMIPAIPMCEDPGLRARIQANLDNLTKPKGSLGRLEECAVRYLLCRGTDFAPLERMALFTFAADHGITAQRITPFPREVTAQMTLNMIEGGAAVSVMCRSAGITCSVVDMGVDGDLPEHATLLGRKIARGTADLSIGPAMTSQQCRNALSTGVDTALSADADLFGVGEMGIGNSAAAAALYALLLDLDGSMTTGKGTGSNGSVLARKRVTVQRAVALHRSEWDQTPLDALRRCGGFEIAGITGFLLGAASKRIPVVIDGFICGAAALTATRIEPAVANYLIYSHVSAERFHRTFLRNGGIKPLLDLGMRLGEGTGAVLAMQIVAQALHCYHEMATFRSASVSREKAVM